MFEPAVMACSFTVYGIVMPRRWSPPNVSVLTASITCWVRMPRTIASSMPREGSWSSVSAGLSPSPKKALPAASPNPFGMTTATASVPRVTRSRASFSVGVVTFRFLSVSAPASTCFEIAERSWSTMATARRAGSRWPELPKSDPKNDPIAIGTTKLTITDRRSVKKSCRSLRTIARNGMTAISRASSFP